MNILPPLFVALNISPMLNKALLWDFGEKDYDVNKHKIIIIQRVVEYGALSDWCFIVKNYDEDSIISIIKQMPSLSNKSINFVCKVFNLDKSDLKCCTKAPWRVQHWT